MRRPRASKLNHSDVKRNLADYLEGDLDLELRAGVDAHIESCEECAREVGEMQQTIGLLRTLPEPETPPMIAANVMRRIRAGETEPSLFGRIARVITSTLEPSFVLPASAIAVAALVVVVVQDPSSLSRFASIGNVDSAAVAADPGLFQTSPNPQTNPRSSRGASNSETPGLAPELSKSFGFGGAPLEIDESSPSSPHSVSGTSSGGGIQFRFELDASQPLAAVRVVPSRSRPFAQASDGSMIVQRDFSQRDSQRLASSPSRNDFGRARRVAQPLDGRGLFSTKGRAAGRAEGSSGGEDPRDEWLSRGLENPADFSRFLAGKNLAEHEIWVSRLAERAESLGLLDDLVFALRTSGDASAAILGDDFAAQAAASGGDDRDWSAPFER